MSTLILCRACGEEIYNLSAKNIFDQKSKEILEKFASLTGIWLDEDEDLPKHICPCCHLDLNHSVAFRERCIKIQKLLPKKTTTLDPLNTTTKATVTTVKINNKPQPQCIIVRARTTARHIVRARSPKQPPTKTEVPMPQHHNRSSFKRVIPCARPEAVGNETTHIASSNKSSPIKASSITDTNGKADEFLQSISPDPNHGPKKKKMKCMVAKSYVCDQCGKCFSDGSNLKLHILRHTGIKNFECTECDAKYFTRHLLNLHIRVRHHGEMPYACKYCEQRFYTSTARCRHERVKHIRKKSFVCRICGKKYLTKSCLNRHEFLHTGDRPYRCEICDVAFPRNTNLKIHYRSKHHQRKANELLDNPFIELDEVSDGVTETEFENSDIEEFYV